MSRSEKLPWIDSHSHVWPAESDLFPLAAGLTTADLDPWSFTDDELMAVARPHGVGRVVLIQHSRYHRFDNSCLIDVVRRHPDLFRVVGMVDDRAPEPGSAMRLLLASGVTGFRITPWIRKDDPVRWLHTPGMHEMWDTAAATRQAMCCLIDPPDLPAVDAMCGRHPDTPVVIDHLARIGADGPIREEDVARLCGMTRHPNVRVKVSGFYGLGERRAFYDDLVPLIRRVFEAFGPQRLMWGSDCPYQLQRGHTYADSIDMIRSRLGFLTDEDREWMLRKTAAEVFFLA